MSIELYALTDSELLDEARRMRVLAVDVKDVPLLMPGETTVPSVFLKPDPPDVEDAEIIPHSTPGFPR